MVSFLRASDKAGERMLLLSYHALQLKLTSDLEVYFPSRGICCESHEDIGSVSARDPAYVPDL